MMVAFIDEHHSGLGVEPICSVLLIAPSTYYSNKAFSKDPAKRSERWKRDEVLKERVQTVWDDNYKVYVQLASEDHIEFLEFGFFFRYSVHCEPFKCTVFLSLFAISRALHELSIAYNIILYNILDVFQESLIMSFDNLLKMIDSVIHWLDYS
jgi:hypothetical protein